MTTETSEEAKTTPEPSPRQFKRHVEARTMAKLEAISDESNMPDIVINDRNDRRQNDWGNYHAMLTNRLERIACAVALKKFSQNGIRSKDFMELLVHIPDLYENLCYGRKAIMREVYNRLLGDLRLRPPMRSWEVVEFARTVHGAFSGTLSVFDLTQTAWQAKAAVDGVSWLTSETPPSVLLRGRQTALKAKRDGEVP